MKFTAFKEFRLSRTVEAVADYLTADLVKFLREMQLGLTRLSFTDNFEAFSVEVTIPATTEVLIRNQLKSGQTPTQRIIVRGGVGSEQIVDGDTKWTTDFVSLQNLSGSEVTATVIFLR